MTKHRTFGPDGVDPDIVTAPSPPAALPGMNATVSNDDLLRFVDGVLDDHGRVRILTYLAAQPAAVGRVEAYLHQNARLRALRDHLPLADSDRFAAPLQAALVDRLCRNHRRRGWRRLAVAASVALAMIGGTAGPVMQGQPGGAAAPTDGHAAYTMQAHFLFDRSDLGAAIELAPEAPLDLVIDGAAFAWLAERSADMVFTAPELDRLGLQLVDGAVLNERGAPAIRAVYQDAAGKPVVLFAGIGKPELRHAFWLEREGYVSLQWRRGAMIFALVAPTDSPKLSDIVQRVGAAVARVPVPEGMEAADGQAAVAPPPAGTGTIEPAPGETGPVQSIAVPLARPEIAGAAPADGLNRETIHPDALLQSAGSNVPEAL